MKIVIRVIKGVRASIQSPTIIFRNANRSYPICGVDDSVPEIYYRSCPKVWMDSTV